MSGSSAFFLTASDQYAPQQAQAALTLTKNRLFGDDTPALDAFDQVSYGMFAHQVNEYIVLLQLDDVRLVRG